MACYCSGRQFRLETDVKRLQPCIRPCITYMFLVVRIAALALDQLYATPFFVCGCNLSSICGGYACVSVRRLVPVTLFLEWALSLGFVAVVREFADKKSLLRILRASRLPIKGTSTSRVVRLGVRPPYADIHVVKK